MLITCIGTLFFLGVLYFNLCKDTEDLPEEEVETQYWWDVFGPLIAIAIINIGGIIMCLF
jgi:hypothetical protein